jgi:hypothetical protein
MNTTPGLNDFLKFGFPFFYFVLFLTNAIAIQGDYIVIIQHMGAVYLEQLHPLHYIPVLLPPLPCSFKQCLVVFVTLSSYVHMQHSFHPSVSFSFSMTFLKTKMLT